MVLEALEEDDPAAHLRTFEFELLQQLGYGVDFSAQGQPLHSVGIVLRHNPVFTRYRVHQAKAHGSIPASFKQSRRVFSAPATQDAAKVLVRVALAPLLGDKPPTSRKMFRR